MPKQDYVIKEINVDYRYWFTQQILFSLIDSSFHDDYLVEEFKRLAVYCDKYCGIPSEFEDGDLLESGAYYKLKMKVDA